jgi:asparagine synthase (glutamine-hydrolysing)
MKTSMSDSSALEKCKGRFLLVAGIYKKGLTTEERKSFYAALEPEVLQVDGKEWQVFSDENILVMGVVSAGVSELAGESLGTGGCLLSFCDEQASLKSRFDQLSQQLNGAWSLVVMNDREGGMLGRDPAGAQSMYYLRKDDALFFASSLTLFRNLGLEVDRNAVADFLHFLYIPAPRTIYQGVRAVMPGQFIRFDGNKIDCGEITMAFSAENSDGVPPGIGDEQCLLAYEDYLQSSMQRCCSEDDRVGLFLSGGKDSSALAISACNSGMKNVVAVTLGFADSEIDESDDARRVTEYLGIPFQSMKFTPETYVEHWPEFIRNLGQPNGDCAALPVFAALKDSADSYDVFLDGTGNDSYFGIPTSWQEDLAWRIHRTFSGIHRLPWQAIPAGGSYSVNVIARFLSTPREEQFVSWNGGTATEIQGLVGIKPDWRESCLYGLYSDCVTSMEHKTATLCRIWEPEAAYRKVVQLANLTGKSVRYPFLDRDLVAFSRNLPTRFKHNGRINKVIIRSLIEKYLPKEVVNKKKGSFIFPKKYILAANNYEYLNFYLSTDCIRKHGLVEAAPVAAYVDRYRRGDISVEDRIWSLVLLHAWAEINIFK